MRKGLISRGWLAAVLVSAVCQPLHASGSSRPDSWFDSAQPQSAQPAPKTETGGQNAPVQQPLTLSDQITRDVLNPLHRGMETQNIQLVLSIFDEQELDSYADLPGQLRAFFQQYAEVRFRYQLLQATADKNQASATAELQMDGLPYLTSQIPSRRSTQMRFELKREAKGWKVTEFSPSDFFSPDFNHAGAR
jgi:hypothetical protein